MTSDDSGAQDRRETRAAKLQEKAREGGEARADYDAAQQATEDKTVRLKALRLAKEQADKRPTRGRTRKLVRRPTRRGSSVSRVHACRCVVGKYVRACPYDPHDHLHP